MNETFSRYLFLDGDKTYLKVEADESGVEVPTQIEILKTGSWDTPNHGKFTVTEQDLDEYVKHFNDKVRAGVPIDIEHRKRGDEAFGWIEGVTKAGDGLWATVKWTKSGASLLADRAYKYFSPEFYPKGYTDPETGKKYDNVLLAGALTNRPLFKSLTPIVASDGTGGAPSDGELNIIYADEGEKSVQLDQVRTKDVSALSTEEKTFLAEHKAELSNNEQTKYGLVEKVAEIAPTAASEDGTIKVAASELEAMKAEIASLKIAASDGTAAKAELEKAKAAKVIDSHVARGAIKADESNAAVELLVTASPMQRTALEDFMSKLPENKLVSAGEIGSEEAGTSANATNDLLKLASDRALEKKIPYDQALLQVSGERADLVKASDAERTKSTNKEA